MTTQKQCVKYNFVAPLIIAIVQQKQYLSISINLSIYLSIYIYGWRYTAQRHNDKNPEKSSNLFTCKNCRFYLILKSCHLDFREHRNSYMRFHNYQGVVNQKNFFDQTDRCKLLLFCLPCLTTKVILQRIGFFFPTILSE